MNRVYKVFLGYLEIRVTKVNLDQLVPLVLPDLMDQQDHKVLKAIKGNKVNRVEEDIKGYLEIRVTKDNLDQLINWTSRTTRTNRTYWSRW